VESMAPLFGIAPDQVDDYPHAWFGSVQQISEQIQRGRERWDVSYLTVQADAMEAMAPVVAALAGG